MGYFLGGGDSNQPSRKKKLVTKDLLKSTELMLFLPLSILVSLFLRRRSSIVPLTILILVLALISLVLMRRITLHFFYHGFVHSYKTDMYDQIIDTEHIKIPTNACPTQFEEEDQVVDF